MENELVQWREEVDTYKKQCMIKAGETAQVNLYSQQLCIVILL